VKKNDAGAADTRTWQAGAAYDFGFAKVFAQYTDVKDKSTAGQPEYKLADVSAAIPVTTAGKVLVAYGRLNRSVGPDLKTVSLAYDHYLSKRTDVYVAAMNDKPDGTSAGKSYAVGVRHRF
jgi:predicted porin